MHIHQRFIKALTARYKQLLQRITLERSCTNCGGSGTVTETRERRLDELTDAQLTFMLEAWAERESQKWGGDESANTNSVPQHGSHGTASNMTHPKAGGPPVQGQTRNF